MQTDFFALFELPKTFSIDITALETRYRQLAQLYHPDKFASASSFEQRQAMALSSTINEAYRILKSDIDRASYILQTHGIDADAPEHTHFAPDFLMQQMQWRETLAEAAMDNDEATLEQLSQEIKIAEQDLLHHLAQALETEHHQEAAQWVRQGRFLNKMRAEIKAAR